MSECLETIHAMEATLRKGPLSTRQLQRYQQAFRDLEVHLQADKAERHTFYIVIPVADRPRQLEQCIKSIQKLCQSFHYAAHDHATFDKIHVIIADDSASPASITANRQLAEAFRHAGMQIDYFGLERQKALFDSLDGDEKRKLKNILGNALNERKNGNFGHKGASITRNLTYLYLNRLHNLRPAERKLFYFIDSDQQFCVNSSTSGELAAYCVNYFYYLDRIFQANDIRILTGKVVGAPPVSPSVMTEKCQLDVMAFLSVLGTLNPQSACQFHRPAKAEVTRQDAAYHDMSKLFGFDDTKDAFHYSCPLHGEHSNHDCYRHFATKTARFFHGDHPTRDTFFSLTEGFEHITPARTIYTGNYVFTPACLDDFISFSSLGLRMAGPTLGRLLQKKYGAQFVSANLPMLHTRTNDETGRSEYRAGVAQKQQTVDLFDEFRRQFFGDVLLFSIIHLCRQGFPEKATDRDRIKQVLSDTADEIRQHYETSHHAIIENNHTLEKLFNDPENWWNREADCKTSNRLLNQFIGNIAHNFDSRRIEFIHDTESRRCFLETIGNVIADYPQDRKHWKQILERS